MHARIRVRYRHNFKLYQQIGVIAQSSKQDNSLTLDMIERGLEDERADAQA